MERTYYSSFILLYVYVMNEKTKESACQIDMFMF